MSPRRLPGPRLLVTLALCIAACAPQGEAQPTANSEEPRRALTLPELLEQSQSTVDYGTWFLESKTLPLLPAERTLLEARHSEAKRSLDVLNRWADHRRTVFQQVLNPVMRQGARLAKPLAPLHADGLVLTEFARIGVVYWATRFNDVTVATEKMRLQSDLSSRTAVLAEVIKAIAAEHAGAGTACECRCARAGGALMPKGRKPEPQCRDSCKAEGFSMVICE